MNDDSSPASAPRDIAFSSATPAPAVPPPIDAAGSARSRLPRGLALAVLLLAVLASVALVFAWRADQRVRGSERELVKRQQDSALQATEAALLARQAQESARDAAAKVALLRGTPQ